MKKLYSMNNQGIQLGEDSPPSIPAGSDYEIEVELFRTGCFKHPKYGVVYVDKAYLNKLIDNHKKRYYKTPVSFDADHDPTKFGALAWLKESNDCLSIKKKKYTDANGVSKTCLVLVGKLLLNSLGYSFIKEKRYRLFSIEIRPNFVSQEMVLVEEEMNGEKRQVFKTIDNIGPVIVSGAFTNRPFILDLDPMKLSEATDTDLQTFSEDDNLEEFSFTSSSEILDFLIFSSKDIDEDEEKEEMDPKDKDKEKNDKEKEFKDPKDPKNKNPFEKEKPKDSEKEKDEEYKEDMDPKEGDEEEDEENMDCEDPKKPVKPVKPSKEKDAAKDYSDAAKEKDKQKEKQMKMNELMAKLSGKSVSDQVALLEGYSMSFSDTDDQTETVMFNAILESKRAQVQSEKDRADALFLKAQADKLRADAESRAALAAQVAEQAKQIGYEQKVQLFCDSLRKENHHESVVKVVADKLGTILPSSREQKFSTNDGTKEDTFDLFGLVKSVLDALPADARLDFSESAADTETKVDPENKPAKKDKEPSNIPSHVETFYNKYSDWLKDEFKFSCVEDLMKETALVNRIDPETGDYKVQ